MNLATALEKPSPMSRLYDNSLNNTNIMPSALIGGQKAKSNTVGQYSSISSTGGENNSNFESSQRSLLENNKKLSKNPYG